MHKFWSCDLAMAEAGNNTPRTKNVSLVSATLAAGMGACLVWLVVVHSFSASIAADDAELAVKLNPKNATALLAVAQARLSGEPSMNGEGAETPAQRVNRIAKDVATARELTAQGILYPIVKPSLDVPQRANMRALAERALAAAPLNATAYRFLAFVEPSSAATETLMRKAVAHSMRETIAVMWLIQTDFLRNNYAEASDYSDIVLRTSPELSEYIVPIMARIAESPGGRAEIERLLRVDPPWRWFFFNRLNMSIADHSTPLELLLDMRYHGIQPAPTEVNPYVTMLMREGDGALAHEAWKKLLPDDRQPGNALIYNEHFLYPPSGAPFDWSFGGGKGIDTEIVNRLDKPGQRALDVQFGAGLTDPLVARQTLRLAPGKYVFHSRFTGRIDARRGVAWQLSCFPEEHAPLGKSEPIFAALSEWRDVSMTFAVPTDNCELQVLQLSLNQVSDSDRIVSGRLWFADLSLRPAR